MRGSSTFGARSRVRAALLALACAAFASCAGGESAPASIEITDSAGVVLVQNPAEFADSSRAPRLTPDLRIGVIEGAPEYQFTQIFGIAEGSGGHIYVLDFRSYNVRVFDPSGQHVRTIGRRGEGPGELERGVRLRVLPGDTLYVLEGSGITGWRLHTFAPDGSLIETRRFAGSRELISESAITPTGEVLMQASRRGPDGSWLPDVLLRTDFTTQTVDTLRELLPARPDVPVAYGGTPAWTLLEDGRLVVGRSDEYRFEFLNPDGTVDRVVTRDLAPRAITDSEKAAIIESRRERAENPSPSAPSPMLEALRRSADGAVADAFPHYALLMPGPRSTLWVLRYPIPAAAGGGTDGTDTWDVFAADGQLLGSVRLESNYPPPWASGEHLYQVVRDELRVPYVQRLRVDWGDGR